MKVHALDGHQFQFSSARHQRATAIAGLWLFLATEVMFFGALLLGWIFCRHWQPAGFDAGARATDLAIGTANTVILLTSSFAYAVGLVAVEAGHPRRLLACAAFTATLGLLFLLLKGLEWHEDFAKHLFPGGDFSIAGPAAGGAALFFVFYFVATGLHAVHMAIGVVLVCWIAYGAWRTPSAPGLALRAETVGLYWSFVDMVWLVLYPLIYLIGRGG